MATVEFLGAAGTVTGSKFLIEAAGQRLLVDCGLYQGLKELRLRNWDRLPVEPASIDWLVLTHGHIDHSGYLPRLMNGGLRGRAYATRGTADLLRILLPDSGHLQEEEAVAQPAILLSGFIFPIADMPVIIQYLTLANPLRHFLVIIRGIFLKGNDAAVLWPHLAALLLIGASVLTVSSLRFRRQLG
jgi:glyoxylase-like metal-dependent hydrolase (beta-lactamase superfamily II)